MRKQNTSGSRRISAIIGAVLFGLASLWLVWLLVHQYTGTPGFALPIVGYSPPVAQVPSLVAAGITLNHTDQASALNQQQAVLIARQLDPVAATKAKKIGTQYVAINYTPTSTPAPHPALNNFPAWLVLFQSIPQDPNDPSADQAPSPNTTHDLYIFLDANTGKELFAVWV